MARWRQAVELGMTDEEIGTLAAIARSRSEAARRVEQAQILLTYRENPSFFAVGQRLGVHHQTWLPTFQFLRRLFPTRPPAAILP